jgi:hypothetical protein
VSVALALDGRAAARGHHGCRAVAVHGRISGDDVIALGQPGKAIGAIAVGFCGRGQLPDGAAVLHGAARQVHHHRHGGIAGGECNRAANGSGWGEREVYVGHLRGHPNGVRGADGRIDDQRAGGGGAIAKAGLAHLDDLRAERHIGNLVAAIARGEHSGAGVALNVDQRAG